MYYVFSKESCPQCTQAKTLLEAKGVEYEVKVLDVDFTREELIQGMLDLGAPVPRTMPQITKGSGAGDSLVYVGGLKELQKDLQNI